MYLCDTAVYAGEGGTVVSADRDKSIRMAEEKRLRLAQAAQSTGFNYNADTTVKGAGLLDRGSRPVEIPAMLHSAPSLEKLFCRVMSKSEQKFYHKPRAYGNKLLQQQQRMLLKIAQMVSACAIYVYVCNVLNACILLH
jgi:hypothetical protein